MKRTVISYKVRPETAAVNEELIRGVFDELTQAEPANVSYTASALDDGVSFLHVVELDRRGRQPNPGIRVNQALQRGGARELPGAT